MVSLNPFKKHENTYKLDEQEIPSLSQINPGSQIQETSQKMPQETLSFQESNQQPQEQSPFPTQNLSQSTSPQEAASNNNQQYHNDVSKAKLETIDSKIALLEAKLSDMDQKIDIILSMVSSEVSDETKANLKLNSMMQSVKKKRL